MRISDWSSDVCSSYLFLPDRPERADAHRQAHPCPAWENTVSISARSTAACRIRRPHADDGGLSGGPGVALAGQEHAARRAAGPRTRSRPLCKSAAFGRPQPRSEEHTSELQSLMRISYAVFCVTKKNT